MWYPYKLYCCKKEYLSFTTLHNNYEVSTLSIFIFDLPQVIYEHAPVIIREIKINFTSLDKDKITWTVEHRKVKKLQTNWSKEMTLKFFETKFSFWKVSLCIGVNRFCINPERNAPNWKLSSVRTSLWMHLSPTTIRDLIIFYFKSIVGVISSYFLSKKEKINGRRAFPLISCVRNFLPSYVPHSDIV